tara:strand:+ start:1182 stop:1370 length:189 start_codon:yes stop_codon:yes gene_type:complete
MKHKKKDNGFIKLKKLTTAQKNKLNQHAKHHTVNHMRAMRYGMMVGKTFDEAHKSAMKKHGK